MMYRMKRDIENSIVDELGSMANEDTRWTPEEVQADAENFGMDADDFIERYLEEAPSEEDLAGAMNEMIALGWTLDSFDNDFDNCESDDWTAADKETCRRIFTELWNDREED